MTQWIITIIILLLAFGYAINKLIGVIRRPKKRPSDPCNGCSSDCAACQFMTKDNLSDKLK
jgi:hypothetical protein